MKEAVLNSVNRILPEGLKETAYVRLFGLMKIPLIWFIRPSVVSMDDQRTVIKVPFSRRNKNHLNSIYFGVLCAGADIAGGLTAMRHIHASGRKISLSFADFHAEFLKRAEGDTYFTNTQGQAISKFVEEVIESGERMNMEVDVVATCPDKLGDEPVAVFKLTLSLKCKG
jgi:acyl-coenzyme A thioesterase PaaI-like protein